MRVVQTRNDAPIVEIDLLRVATGERQNLIIVSDGGHFSVGNRQRTRFGLVTIQSCDPAVMED
jgi:hypothetical protein